jgi:sensor c-di-GMP phosphodiesterase-like protein
MHNRLLHELELKNALSDALDNRELQVHYQPIVSLESGEIVALEALVP